MYRAVDARELGLKRPRHLRCRIAERLTSSPLFPCNRVDARSAHFGQAINCLEIEQTSYRFLLSAANNGTIAVFNLETNKEQIRPLGLVRHEHRSLSGVASATWFPADNGIFLTAGYNGALNVWDTEAAIGGGSNRPVASHFLDRTRLFGRRDRLSASCLFA